MSDNSLPEIKRPLSVTELRFINWVEQYWNKYQKFPRIGVCNERWSEELGNIIQVLSTPVVIRALTNRGIKVPSEQGMPDELTDEQVAAVSLILDYSDKRSHNTKLRSLGITPAKWQGWLKNEVFKDYLHTLSANGLSDALHVAHTGLIHATERGDTNAIKYYMELTGRFSSESASTQNFKIMISRIIEAVQRHVKDPDVIRLIAADFKVIVEGGTPETNPVLMKELI